MIRITIGGALLALSGLFWAAYYSRYFKSRDCFNELGRCYDPETGQVLLQQSGLVWGSAAMLTLVPALYLLIGHVRQRRSQA